MVNLDIALDESSAPSRATPFAFTPLEEGAKHAFPSLQPSATKDLLTKWNLDQYTHARAFRFDQPFTPEATEAFLLDFFASPEVQSAAPVCVGKGNPRWGALGAVAGPSSLKYEKLPTTVLRLDFFDRLSGEDGVVRQGDIMKCFDVQCGEVLVSDRLRKLFLDESSEEWALYSDTERSELIFHVLRRLAVGGGMNQYDDSVEPYLALTKALYKDLVAVSKTAAGALQVSSLTFAVESVDGASSNLFPRPSPHNFCYVVVDPIARHVKMWYSAWFPMM